MNLLRAALYFTFFVSLSSAYAQVSLDCKTAIKICNNTPINSGTTGFGEDDFVGVSESGCLERTISGSIESNSAWYRFRTGASGQLGFNISTSTNEDWDFALYKTADCSDLGEPVRCNFLDNSDKNSFLGVGEDPTGVADNIQFEDWLQVSPGEDYYLLINNFSNTNSGFSIQFSGHIFVTDPYTALDCAIVTNLLGSPIAACEGDEITLDATTADAVEYNWFQDLGSGFVEIVDAHDPTLKVTSSALYRVEIPTRTGNKISSDVRVGFSKQPVSYPLMDEIFCSETVFDLSAKDSEVLGDQSPNDFVVSYHNTEEDATTGANSLPKNYTPQSGSKIIYVRVTSTTNPNCFDAGQDFEFVGVSTPEFTFSEEAIYCKGSAGVLIGAMMSEANYSYSWNTGETTPNILVSQEGSYTLTVTNNSMGLSCVNSRTVTVVEAKPPVIASVKIEGLQINNSVTVNADFDGDWEYRIDDGEFQSENKFLDVAPGYHTVAINDLKGCGLVSREIVVVGFPKFFTPNGDGINDYWHIVSVSSLDTPNVNIYDRYGMLVYQLNQDHIGWDGTFKGNPLPSDDYWFQLTYIDHTGDKETVKEVSNHFSLIR